MFGCYIARTHCQEVMWPEGNGGGGLGERADEKGGGEVELKGREEDRGQEM